MEKETTSKKENKRSIQDYLSLGYIYLLALGIIRDAVYYGFLDINFLSYSGITDVLLSPIIYLTKNIVTPITIILMIGFIIWVSAEAPKFHKRHRAKKWYKLFGNTEKLDKQYAKEQSIDGSLFLVALLVFAFYLGSGLGGGAKYASKIEKGDFEMSHQLIFDDGEQLEVKIMGQNSQYLFYLTPNSKKVTVSPIIGNIKKIKKLKTVKKEKPKINQG